MSKMSNHKITTILLGMLLVGGYLSGQNVRVNDLPAVQWTQGGSGTTLLYVDNQPMKVFSSDGAILATSPEGIEKKPDRICFLVIVVNKFKDQAIDVDPSKFTLAMTRPVVKQMESLSPESISRSIQKSAAWDTVFLRLNAAFARTETTANTTSDGTFSGRASDTSGDSANFSGNYMGSSTTKISAPDVAARERSLAQAHEVQEQADNKSLVTSAVALKHNTLLPGQQMAGYVWFKWDKHADEVVLRVPLMNDSLTSGVVYEFPYTRPGPVSAPTPESLAPHFVE